MEDWSRIIRTIFIVGIITCALILTLTFALMVRACTEPNPPADWRHKNDTPAIIDGDNAYCVLENTSIVLPGGTFCTGEGLDL